MTTFNVNNFNKNNTPPKTEKLANTILAITASAAALSGVIIALPATIPGFVLTATLIKIAATGAVIGSIGGIWKTISKLWGMNPPPDAPVQ